MARAYRAWTFYFESTILYLMAESLREAACVGNLFAVKKMLNNGVCVNSQNAMNGW